jgi:hypothetical protein
VALDSWLSSDVTIQRATETLDAYGNAALTWATVDTGPGRLVEKRQRIWSDERKESLVVTSPLLLVGPGLDVLERDRAIVDSATFTITALLVRKARATHHLSLAVERVE